MMPVLHRFAQAAALMLLCSSAVVAADDCSRLIGAERFDPALDECFVGAIRAGGQGMERLLAPEFSYSTAVGTRVDAAFLLAWLGSEQNPRGEMHLEQQQTRDLGTMALSDGLMVGVSPPAAAGAPERRSRYLHVWVRQQDGWRLLARQVTLLPAVE